MHFTERECAPQTLSSPAAPNHDNLPPGRKTPPGVSALSAGLRQLIVSRVKCGGGPCRGHAVLPCTGNTICLHCAFIKGARFGICLQKHVVAATGPSPTNFPRGRKTQPSPSPHRTWSVPDASSQPQLNLHLNQNICSTHLALLKLVWYDIVDSRFW